MADRRLMGRSIIVTGGSSGIGRASARLFAAEGALVVVADLDELGGKETCAAITSAGGEAVFARVDVTQEDSVAAMVELAVNTFGGLHGAFNNAGVAEAPARFEDTALETWHRILAIDLTGVFLCMKHELRHMAKNGGGAIVNTSSVAGHSGAPGRVGYSAAKHGVLGLTKLAAREYARRGVRVNAVSPGLIDTPALRGSLDAAGFDALAERTAPGRIARPEEVAQVAAWLLSDGATYVSGETVVVDHGALAR